MTNQERLTWLNNMRSAPTGTMVSAYNTVIDDLIEFVKAAEPVKYKQDRRIGKECYCGKCGSYVGWRFGIISDLLNYCPECGRKVDKTL